MACERHRPDGPTGTGMVQVCRVQVRPITGYRAGALLQGGGQALQAPVQQSVAALASMNPTNKRTGVASHDVSCTCHMQTGGSLSPPLRLMAARAGEAVWTQIKVLPCVLAGDQHCQSQSQT